MKLIILALLFIILISGIVIATDLLFEGYLKRMKAICMGIGILVEKQNKEFNKLRKFMYKFYIFIICGGLLYIFILCMLWP
jgi:hypothetical protein